MSSRYKPATSKGDRYDATQDLQLSLRTRKYSGAHDPFSDESRSAFKESQSPRGIAPPMQPLSCAQSLHVQPSQRYTVTDSGFDVICLVI